MKIGIIGLGNMGRAIAEASIRANHDTAVWNRSPEKALAFHGRAEIAESLEGIIRLAEALIWILPDYGTTAELFDDPAIGAALKGKVFIQLCSGTPDEARVLSEKVEALGADYLDGKIFTYPARVGAEMTRFAYSGNEEAYRRCEGVLRAFGARSGWLGADPGFAAAADLAWLSYLYGSMVGIFQGLAFTRAEGLPDDAVFGSIPSWLEEINGEARYSRDLIARGDFHGSQAALDVHFAAMQHLLETARGKGVSSAFPAMVVDVFGEAIRRGSGVLEITGGLDVFCNPKA